MQTTPRTLYLFKYQKKTPNTFHYRQNNYLQLNKCIRMQVGIICTLRYASTQYSIRSVERKPIVPNHSPSPTNNWKMHPQHSGSGRKRVDIKIWNYMQP